MHWLILSLTFPLFNFGLKLKKEKNINERKKEIYKLFVSPERHISFKSFTCHVWSRLQASNHVKFDLLWCNMKDTAWSNALQGDLSHVGDFKRKTFADKDNTIKQWLVWIKVQYFHDVSQFGIIRDILGWEKDQLPVCREMTKVRQEAFGRAAVLGKGSGLRQALHLKEYFHHCNGQH